MKGSRRLTTRGGLVELCEVLPCRLVDPTVASESDFSTRCARRLMISDTSFSPISA